MRQQTRLAGRTSRSLKPQTAQSGVLQRACACGQHAGGTMCEDCRRKRAQVAPPVVEEVLRGPSRPLDQSLATEFGDHFGWDFSQVRLHTGTNAARSARAVNAETYTVGSHIVFGEQSYSPKTVSGRELIAHELAHVVQQNSAPFDAGGTEIAPSYDAREREADAVAKGFVSSDSGQPQKLELLPPREAIAPIQRKIGDGHDLTSPRFALIEDLEAAFDGEVVIQRGNSGRGVQAIQHALYDLGFPLPVHGADGRFGPETESAVKAFQAAQAPPLMGDGKVGPRTMAALEARFGGAPTLPPSATLNGPWSVPCVCSVLCPWSPHTINVLGTRIILKSFDSISWEDEEWNGVSWIPAPFQGGGYNTGGEIGIRNTTCSRVSETLYHEVLHAEQPSSHTTTLAKESYAYRIGEEFSIAMGLSGRPSLRSSDPRGREFADTAKVTAFVSSAYPSVPSSGPQEQILRKVAPLGHVEVRRPDGSIYTRPAAIGEKVPGPIRLVNEQVHPAGGWVCPP